MNIKCEECGCEIELDDNGELVSVCENECDGGKCPYTTLQCDDDYLPLDFHKGTI